MSQRGHHGLTNNITKFIFAGKGEQAYSEDHFQTHNQAECGAKYQQYTIIFFGRSRNTYNLIGFM